MNKPLKELQDEAGDRLIISPKAKSFKAICVCKNCGDKMPETSLKRICSVCREYNNINEEWVR